MSTKTEGDSPTDAGMSLAANDTMTVTMPKNPDKITFEADEIMIGTDRLCMFGDWGIDFEKIQTLEFIMGEKRDKRYTFKKV